MSAEKTLEVLDVFTIEQKELTVPEIAQLLNHPQSSVYRHLRTLKDKGYVIELYGGKYKLGYRFLELAKIVKSDSSLSAISLPIMKELTRTTGETSILLIPSGLQTVCLETVTSKQPIKVASEQGKIVPLYGGASSKAILAFMPDTVVDELFQKGIVTKQTSHTILDSSKLKEELAIVRKQGFAFSDGEIDEGVMAYGVPIRDMDNQVIASLSIAGPSDRLGAKDQDMLIQILFDSAKEIEKYV